MSAPADTAPAPSPLHPYELRYVAKPIATDGDDTLYLVTHQDEPELPLLSFHEPPFLVCGQEARRALVLTPERALEIASALTGWALAEMRAGR